MKGGAGGGKEVWEAEGSQPRRDASAVIHQRLLEWELDLPAAPRASAWRWRDTRVMYLFDYCPASWHVRRWSMAAASRQPPGLHNAAWRTALWGPCLALHHIHLTVLPRHTSILRRRVHASCLFCGRAALTMRGNAGRGAERPERSANCVKVWWYSKTKSASLVGLTFRDCRFSCSDWLLWLHQVFIGSSVR